MKLNHYTINGETIAMITLFGSNRHPDVTQWHHKVMVEHFGFPINYLDCPFAQGVSHGQMMNYVLSQTVDSPNRPDYYWWLDNDALILRRQVVEDVYFKVKDKMTLWGNAWRSSHKKKPREGDHPYASQANMCFATSLYNSLGRPDCDHHTERSDTAEELTYACEAKGYTVALQWPSYSETYTTQLGQVSTYGRGNIYGPNQTYHESRADLPGHVERFITKCKEVIAGSYESDTSKKPYSYAV